MLLHMEEKDMPDCPEMSQSGLARYNYTRSLSPSRWAWEFLRRNKAFLDEAARHGEEELSVRTACHGITLIRPRTEQMAAERWGLAFFPDPGKNGYDADVFWSAALHPRQVHVQVSPAGRERSCDIYRKTVEACRIIHLVDTAGREHMLVKGNGHVVQVRCTGMSMLSPEPVRLGFLIRDAGDFQARLQVLTKAQRVYDGTSGQTGWTRTSLALRNALIAADCHEADLSIRETAAVIYGKQRADEAWAGPSRAMKDEIRRARAKGLGLVSGGYRDLLQYPGANRQQAAA